MNSTGRYLFDKAAILEKSYELLCFFLAEKEIARIIKPEDDHDPINLLKRRFFEAKVSRLLIEIAASMRVLEDQINSLANDDNEKTQYKRLLLIVDTYGFDLFDEYKFRYVCNKIIHSNTFQILTQKGHEAHELDTAFDQGMGDREINWNHNTSIVRLSGRYNRKNWHVLLDVRIFVAAIVKLLGDQVLTTP